jgi:tetratricopeptide (TPR) repeat protein
MDPYAPCPCGSGKKVKFCCQKIVPEMEKIDRLQDNQPELALQHLNKLEEKHPGNPWLVTSKAGIMMQAGEFPEAKLALLRFLKEHPDHPRANALYAFASFHADGFPACKKAVHRAFKRCVAETPQIVSSLMAAIGEHHLMAGSVVAARAHFMIAMRIASTEETRRQLVSHIMRIDSDPSIGFPLRGGNALPAYEGPEAVRGYVEKARRLSILACWEEAADLLEEAAEQDQESAPLWHTIGLFRAWDGDEESAGEALFKAARLYGDDPVAVECETLAQLLDRMHSDRVTEMRLKRFKLTSLSQLLSRLDQDSRFVRVPSERDQQTAGEPVATYLALDRPLPPDEELADLNCDTVPIYLGRVMLFDSVPDDEIPALAFLTGLEGEQLDTVLQAFTSAAGDLATPIAASELLSEAERQALPEGVSETDAEMDVIGEIFNEELPLHRNYFVPPGAPGNVRAEILDAHWDRILHDAWPSTPQQILGGKTPRDAAGDPSMKVALTSAVYVLDTFFDERQQILPIREVFQQLQLDPPSPPEIESDTAVSTLSSFDLLRIDFKRLSDVQLDQVIERLHFARHTRLLYEALREWISRDVGDALEGKEWMIDTEGAAAMLMQLAAEARRPQEALDWSARGQQMMAASDERAFEKRLTWKLRELRVHVAHSQPDALRGLLLELWENYGAKMPSLRQQLNEVVATLKMDAPWEKAIVTAGEDWSPAAAASDPSKKLWLPGQD